MSIQLKTRKFNASKRRNVNTKRTSIDIRNYKLLKSLKRNYKDRLNVTFNLIGGASKVVPINNEALKDINNDLLSEEAILIKLNTIKYDYGAESYIINKLF